MKRCFEASSAFAETQPPSGEKSLSIVRTVCADRCGACAARSMNPFRRATLSGELAGPAITAKTPMLVLQQRLGGDHAALHVVGGKTLLAEPLENRIEHDDIRLLAAERDDVLLRAAHCS